MMRCPVPGSYRAVAAQMSMLLDKRQELAPVPLCIIPHLQ